MKKSQKWLSIEIAAPCNYFLCTLLNPEIDVVKIAVENVFEFAGIYSKLLKYVYSGPPILWSQKLLPTVIVSVQCTTMCDKQRNLN